MNKLILSLSVIIIGFSSCSENSSRSNSNIECDSLIRETKKYSFSGLSYSYPISGHIKKAEIKELIDSYKIAPIPGLETAKGFYLDTNFIDSIRNHPEIKSIYLYLGKKKLDPNSDPKYDGKYTVIAIPAKIVTDPNTQLDSNELMIPQSLEWHDLIEIHKPTNDSIVGY